MTRDEALVWAKMLAQVNEYLKQIRKAEQEAMDKELAIHVQLETAVRAGLITEHEAGISVSVH